MRKVLVEVIKQYVIEVSDEVHDPKIHVENMQSSEIEKIGDLHNVETCVVDVELNEKTVYYTVKYRCEVDDNQDPDSISNIDIPEGGANNSKYLEDSFEFVGNDGDNHVFYTVMFSCASTSQTIEDIDIPEGGKNNSEYCKDSFVLVQGTRWDEDDIPSTGF
jgi:hypothetical protein